MSKNIKKNDNLMNKKTFSQKLEQLENEKIRKIKEFSEYIPDVSIL